MLKDDTQRYGMLNDDALIKLCTDFPIGIYTSKSCLQKRRFLVWALPTRPRHSEWSEAESNCEAAPNEVRWNLGRTGINREAVMRRSVA